MCRGSDQAIKDMVTAEEGQNYKFEEEEDERRYRNRQSNPNPTDN